MTKTGLTFSASFVQHLKISQFDSAFAACKIFERRLIEIWHWRDSPEPIPILFSCLSKWMGKGSTFELCRKTFLQKSLNSCLSPPRCIIGYQRNLCWGQPCDGLTSHPRGCYRNQNKLQPDRPFAPLYASFTYLTWPSAHWWFSRHAKKLNYPILFFTCVARKWKIKSFTIQYVESRNQNVVEE